jgi:hypothetical protein
MTSQGVRCRRRVTNYTYFEKPSFIPDDMASSEGINRKGPPPEIGILHSKHHHHIFRSKHQNINLHIKTTKTNTLHTSLRIKHRFKHNKPKQTKQLRNGSLSSLSTIRCFSIPPVSQERGTKGRRRREAAQQGGQRSVPSLLWREQLPWERTVCWLLPQVVGYFSAIN